MGRLIKDEFTDLPVSRQRKYQLRMERGRRCIECGEPAIEGRLCLKHLVQARELQRITG
jgi:ribosomal protein L32